MFGHFLCGDSAGGQADGAFFRSGSQEAQDQWQGADVTTADCPTAWPCMALHGLRKFQEHLTDHLRTLHLSGLGWGDPDTHKDNPDAEVKCIVSELIGSQLDAFFFS